MNGEVKEQLVKEILIANAEDSKAFLADIQTLTLDAENEAKKPESNVSEVVRMNAKTKTDMLKELLKRKKLIKQTIEEL